MEVTVNIQKASSLVVGILSLSITQDILLINMSLLFNMSYLTCQRCTFLESNSAHRSEVPVWVSETMFPLVSDLFALSRQALGQPAVPT